jgi:superfamily II DNA helicase RecQ
MITEDGDSDYGFGSDVEAELNKSFDQAEEAISDYGFDSDDEADLEAVAEVAETPMKKSQASFNTSVPSPAVDPPRRSTGGIKPPLPPPPTYPTTSPVALNTLRACFGLPSFRLKQEAAISRLLAGGSAVVVFPTGGGKSLCYQVRRFAQRSTDC